MTEVDGCFDTEELATDWNSLKNYLQARASIDNNKRSNPIDKNERRGKERQQQSREE